jgi:hypothetical protein
MIRLAKVSALMIAAAFIFSSGFAFAASDSTKAGESRKESKGKLPSGEERFMKEAASGGLMEVELGKIAAEKG